MEAARAFGCACPTVLLAALLAGCPDDGGRAAPPPAPTPALAGVVSLGEPFESYELRVGAADSAPRGSRVGRDGAYRLSSLALAVPAIIGVPNTLLSATTRLDTPANVTPLTHLQLVEVLRADPLEALSPALDSRSGSAAVDFSPITADALARAQARVVALLAERLDYLLPDAVAEADFVSTPLANLPGDPTYDALAGLAARLAERGTSLTLLVRERVRALEPCTRFFVDLRVGDRVSEFCANTRTTVTGPTDVHRYTALDGATLVVEARESELAGVTLTLADGRRHGCTAAACAGATRSAADADGQRRLTFAGLRLPADDGRDNARLDGVLATAPPGLPALDCDGARAGRQPLQIRGADGSTDGRCLQLAAQPAGSRTIYRDLGLDGSEGLRLSIHADDRTPASIALYRLDRLGRAVTDYRCEAAACTGFDAGPLFARPGSARNRELRLAGTPLRKVGDGPGPEAVQLDARLVVALGNETAPPSCALSPPTERVRARVSTEAADWNICPPYDLSENGTVSVQRVGALDYGGRHLGALRYGFDNAAGIPGSLTVIASAGLVRRVEYSRGRAIASDRGRLDDELFACEGFACRGIDLDPAGEQVGHAIRFAAATLAEERYDGSATGRRVTLDGALLSAPDCLAAGRCRAP